eukprot:scaffold395_cov243-Pinguiococcus_pyrenoidosus.AAC.23
MLEMRYKRSSRGSFRHLKRCLFSRRGPPGLPGLPGRGPPGLPGRGPPGLPMGPQLAPKPKVAPPKKMKGFFWTKLKDAQCATTVWKDLRDLPDLDTDQLVDLFAAPEKKAKVGAEEKKEEKKEQKISLVDGKRNQNVLIGRGRFRLTNEQLRDAMIALDPTILTVEAIEKLKNIIPTPEEVSTVTSFDGDVSMLGDVEKMFIAVSTVPRLKQRLDSYLFVRTYDDNYEQVKAKVETFEAAAREICGNRKINRVLEVVLAIGNYLNGGTNRGQAYGFKMDSILKLKDARSSKNGKLNLMHFLVMQVEAHRAADADFYNELRSVAAASDISMDQMKSDINVINSGVKKLQNELENGSGSGSMQPNISEPFRKRIEPVAELAKTQVDDLQQRLAKLCEKLSEKIGSYGEKCNNKDDIENIEKFIHTMHSFAEHFENARRQNQERIEQEEKAKQKAEEKAKRAAARGRAPTAPPQGTDLFKQYEKAQNGDTGDIVAEFRSRMRNRQSVRYT